MNTHTPKTNAQENPTDDEVWDELLNSEDGKMALDYLLTNADFEIKTGQVKKD